MIEHQKGNHEKAKSLFDIAWQLIMQTQNERKKALCQKGFGMCYFSFGNHQKAIEYYQQMYIYCMETSNEAWLNSACYDLTEAFHMAQNAYEAKKYYEQGIELARSRDNKKELRILETLPQELARAKYLVPNLTERQMVAVQIMLQEGKITNQRFRQATELSSNRTVVDDLNILMEKGVCKRLGNGRSVHYMLVE